METYPGRTTRAVEQSIEYRPVRNRVGAVFHPFGFAIGTSYRAGIEMVAANDYRRAEFPFGDHFNERQPKSCAFAKSNPADARRQPLEMDFLARHIQPAVQMRVIRDQFLYFGIGFVNVFRVAGERRPAERADATAE